MMKKTLKSIIASAVIASSLVCFNPADVMAQNNVQIRYFMQAPNVQGSETPYGNNISKGKYVQSDDAKIYYEVYGEGTPILIMHGGGVGSPYELGKILDELQKDHKVICMSTRGHGRSEIGHTEFSYEQKAKDAYRVIEAVTNEPVQIIGFSDGAYGAYKVASMYPEKVDRVIAIGAGSLEAGFFPDTTKVEDLAQFDNDFIELQKQINPEPERMQEFWDMYMKFWHGMNVDKDFFNSIKCPVLLIVGDEDDHAPILTVLDAHQAIPNSSIMVVPKAWHSAFLDNYELTWTAIKQFVNTNKASITGSKKIPMNNR